MVFAILKKKSCLIDPFVFFKKVHFLKENALEDTESDDLFRVENDRYR